MKRMKIIRREGAIFLTVCLLACLIASGCATTKKISYDIMGKGRALKKKVAFLGTINRSGYGGTEFADAASIQLKSSLKAYGNGLVLVDSRNLRKAMERVPRSYSGQIDTLALAKVGKKYGINAVIEQSIEGIQGVTEKRGIWGFRHTCFLARLSMRIVAYDVETATILYNQMFQRTVEVSEEEWQGIKKGNRYEKGVANRLLAKMIPDIRKNISRRLGNEPWKGYICAVSDDTFTLAAGKEVGLAEGDILEVFGAGKPIRGTGGRIYLIPGQKIGEIKITKVLRSRAEATAISGHDLERSGCVRLKR